MATDITISLEHRPGTLADAAEALGRANINIEGICGQTVSGRGVMHLLVEDPDGAQTALEAAGVKIQSQEEMLVIGVEDKPGVLGKITRALADASINIHTAYLASATRLVLGVDNLEKARQVVGRGS